MKQAGISSMWRRLALGVAFVLFAASTGMLVVRLGEPVPGSGSADLDRRLGALTRTLRSITPQQGATPVDDLEVLLSGFMRLTATLDSDPSVPPSTRQRLHRATEWIQQTPTIQRRLPLEGNDAVRKALEIEFRAAVDLAVGEVRGAIAELRNPPASLLIAERGVGSMYLAVGSLAALLIVALLLYHEWVAALAPPSAVFPVVHEAAVTVLPAPVLPPRDDFPREALERAVTEFGNTLTAINGYSDLLLSLLSTDDPVRGDIEQIRAAGERAAILSHELARLAGSTPPPQPITIDVNAIVQELLPSLRRIAGDGIAITSGLFEAPKLVSADPIELRHHVALLVLKARDTMPDGGSLVVSTGAGGAVSIERAQAAAA